MTTHDIESLKREAKRIARATTISHAQALEVLAVQRGHRHWGSLLRAADEPSPATNVRPIDPQALLKALLGPDAPDVAGARHLVVTGLTSTGKTRLLNRILEGLPHDRRMTTVEDTREIEGPPSAVHHLVPRTDDPSQEGGAIRRALSARPDVLVVGEISNGNVGDVIDAMRDAGGPMVLTTLHASAPGEVQKAVAQRAHHRRGPTARLPGDVAIVHVVRTAEGPGRIGEITTIRMIEDGAPAREFDVAYPQANAGTMTVEAQRPNIVREVRPSRMTYGYDVVPKT